VGFSKNSIQVLTPMGVFFFRPPHYGEACNKDILDGERSGMIVMLLILFWFSLVVGSLANQ
jgi:hypothetical protein